MCSFLFLTGWKKTRNIMYVKVAVEGPLKTPTHAQPQIAQTKVRLWKNVDVEIVNTPPKTNLSMVNSIYFSK